jgi:tetratricopeptide (TPR) repeat protein
LLAQTQVRDPDGAAALCLHAMRRGWAVLMQADDSNGDIGGLIQSIGAEWVEALRQAGPQPAAFGDAYLHLLLDDPFGCFETAAAEAAMGNVALARYRKVLAARWHEAKDAVLAARAEHAALAAQAAASRKRPPHYTRDSERDMRLWTLERMHLNQLEADGDIEGALAVMREDMTQAGSFRQVTAFLERHGRLREALANAELACKVFPDDSRLQEDLLRCYERDGWVEEAFALQRRRFDDGPSVERYHDVLKAGAAAARDVVALRAELQAELTAREEQGMTRSASRPTLYGRHHGADADQRDARSGPRCCARRAVAARRWRLVLPPAYCREGVLAYLARRLRPEHLAQRIELLMRAFASEMCAAAAAALKDQAVGLSTEVGNFKLPVAH